MAAVEVEEETDQRDSSVVEVAGIHWQSVEGIVVVQTLAAVVRLAESL